MFDIGFPELVVIAIVGLLVIGPERMPEALRTLGLWLGRMRRSFVAVKNEIEKEIGMDEVRRQLHNEAVMEEMKRIENEVRTTVDETSLKKSPAVTDRAASDERSSRTPAQAAVESAPKDSDAAGAEPSAQTSGDKPSPPSASNGQH